ncbi:MAG: sensor histidine kinase [Phycisphaerae bacterium]|nr:sensor histidine kinase [Phycisphaerae bacterium]
MTPTQSHVSMTDRERELGAIIAAYNDVTERLKESHDQLRQQVHRLRLELADKNRELARRERLAALGEMAAGLAHEIRNPLGGIQLFAGLLTKDLADRPRERGLAEKISNGVRTLDGIVTDILAFAGEAEPRLAPVHLGRLIPEALDLAAATFEQWGTQVRWASSEAKDEALMMEADPNQLQRALLNLLQNAADAAGTGGCVEVTASADAQERVHVAVADNGPGIPSELLDRIFNPFFTTKDRGTGLGLAIVHRIIEAHGGSVRATNREQGGAMFSVSLPKRRCGDAALQWEIA